MKGQVNIEYIAAAVVYLIALFGLMTVGSNVLPNFTSNVDQASLNMEAHHVSSQVLTQPGYSAANGGTENWHENTNTLGQISSFGLGNSSESFLTLDRDKLERMQSFSRNQPDQYFNYSQFKNITDAENQYIFNFTWIPIVETHHTYNRGNMNKEIVSSIARYRFEQQKGSVEDSWGDYTGQTRSNNGDGPERGVDGIQDTRAFSFDREDEDYVISQDEAEIPERYSIFTWVNAEEHQQSDWTYLGGFNNAVSLAIHDGSGPTIGLLVRQEGGDDDEWHEVWEGEPNILDGSWHHFGATVDRDSGVVKIYVDGELVHEDTIPDHWDGEQELIMGTLEEPNHHFTGKLDDFRIYSEALSGEEVESLYHERVIPDIQPPDTDYYRSSENTVRFGEETLNGQEYKFLITAHNGVYNTTYVSEDWDFSSKTPIGEGDRFSLHGNTFRVDKIRQEEPNAGSVLVLNQHLKEFGPNVDSNAGVIRIDRYGVMDGEPVRAEVLAW